MCLRITPRSMVWVPILKKATHSTSIKKKHCNIHTGTDIHTSHHTQLTTYQPCLCNVHSTKLPPFTSCPSSIFTCYIIFILMCLLPTYPEHCSHGIWWLLFLALWHGTANTDPYINTPEKNKKKNKTKTQVATEQQVSLRTLLQTDITGSRESN